ncbi:MAG: class I SAM-dependent methyltransferase [Candidatus Bipolaricaulota bacterium]
MTGWRYRGFIARAIDDMKISPSDRILDMGAGSGYNAEFMAAYLGGDGGLLGLDIGEEAIEQFKSKFPGSENVRIENRRVDRELPYEAEFDKAFTSFVLHGLPHESRMELLANAYRCLKDDGRFFILDYGDFELSEMPFYIREPFKLLECKYAFDYLNRDWYSILNREGFEVIDTKAYYKNFARLITAGKAGSR